MSIMDLTSMAEAQKADRQELEERLRKLRLEAAERCYQCGKCTSGCEAHKLLELEPHRIVALTKAGLFAELTASDKIWTCVSCFKCYERCPQKVAPVNILFALKNLSVLNGKDVPGNYTAMLQSAMSIGLVQDVQEVVERKGTVRTRGALCLPPAPRPKDMERFAQAIMGTAVEKV
jgi:heterodisulfide reductase subunit C